MKSFIRVTVSLTIILFAMLQFQKEKTVQASSVIELTALGIPYTQDFNSLSNTVESGVLPPGWSLAETGTYANSLYGINNGAIGTADTYSFGSTDATDRALGGIQGTDLVPLFGASFENNTGGMITSLMISFTGEQWRSGKVNRPDVLTFQLSTDATNLENGTWLEYENLIFRTPNTLRLGAKDGNASAYRQFLNHTITGLTIENGETFRVRWLDHDAAKGDDDGLAVDDFSLTPLGVDNSPIISSIAPADYSSDVTINSEISITFSEPVNLASNWFTLNCATSGLHTANVSGGPLHFKLEPDDAFANSESCTITLYADKVSDIDGSDPPDNMSENFVSRFSTTTAPDAAPVVASTFPLDKQTGVLLSSVLSVQFSEPVAVSEGWYSLECSHSGIHSAEVTDGPVSYMLTPLLPFENDEICNLTIYGQSVSDLDGGGSTHVMPSNYGLTFYTLAAPDDAPFIASSIPSNNEINIHIDQDLVITFSEAVVLSPDWFELNCSKSGLHTASVTGGTSSFTVNPDDDFDYGETCTIKVNAQKISDLDSNDPPDNLVADQNISFKTEAMPDAAPLITQSSPKMDDTGVPVDSNITLTFNEAVTTSGDWFSLVCTTSGSHTAQTTIASETVSIDAVTDFANNETCSFRVIASQIMDVDTNDPPDNMEVDYSFQFTTAVLLDSPPYVTNTYPADGAVDVPISGELSITFSEPVTLLQGWIDFSCEKSGVHYVTINDGPVKFTLGVDSDYAYAEKCTVLLKAARIIDQDVEDPPDKMSSDYTFSFATENESEMLTYPIIVEGDNTYPTNGEVLEEGIHSLKIQFSKDVLHDGSDDAADNIQNYRLFFIGPNNIFDNNSCKVFSGDDYPFSIDQVQYDPTTFTAEVFINQGKNLLSGDYRLILCGSSTIRDLYGNPLNDGADSIIDFTVDTSGLDGGDGGGGDNGGSKDLEKFAANTGLFIPVTGFAPNRITPLTEQKLSYSEYGDLWLEIPSMKLKIAIVGVPQEDGLWDVSWLNKQLGWLEGSAFPTAEGNSVLTGHVWDAFNQPGPFYGLEKLKYGEQVIVHSGEDEFVYEVRQVKSVAPENVSAMMKHQEDAWLTLVTCQGYDEESGTYQRRILVRAALVEVW